MAAINPISGIRPPIQPIAANGVKANASGEKADFAGALKNYVNKINQDQTHSVEAIQNLLSGKSDDILPVVAAVAKADMSFKLLMGVRNKVIEAYKQTMNMQV